MKTDKTRQHGFRRMVRTLVLSILLAGTSLYAAKAEDCQFTLDHPKREFLGPADEIAYFSQYHTCWAEAAVLSSKPSRYHFLGKGLEVFSHPEYIEGIGFSKLFCGTIDIGRRSDYPCWLETESIRNGESIEAAVKHEAPKVLIATLIKNNHKNANDTVEFVFCPNDDPTKPKEYTKGCRRGLKMEITEYGRGDVNRDGVEDLVVRIRYGQNGSAFRRCYMAVFTRKNAEMFKLINYSIPGQCE